MNTFNRFQLEILLAAIHHLLKVHPNNDNYRKIESNWYRLNNY
jgi:hypothetical protein